MLCSVQLDVKLVIATANYFFYLDGNVHFFNAACMIFFSFISCCIKETLIWKKKKNQSKGYQLNLYLLLWLSLCPLVFLTRPPCLMSSCRFFCSRRWSLNRSHNRNQWKYIYIYFLILHEHRNIWKQVLHAIITRRELYVLCRSKVHSCVYVSLCR